MLGFLSRPLHLVPSWKGHPYPVRQVHDTALPSRAKETIKDRVFRERKIMAPMAEILHG